MELLIGIGYFLMFCVTLRWLYRNTGELYGIVTTYGCSRLWALVLVIIWSAFWPIFWVWALFERFYRL
jgi:hypothetical protein